MTTDSSGSQEGETGPETQPGEQGGGQNGTEAKHAEQENAHSGPGMQHAQQADIQIGAGAQRAKQGLLQRAAMVTNSFGEDDCTCFDTTLGCMLQVSSPTERHHAIYHLSFIIHHGRQIT